MDLENKQENKIIIEINGLDELVEALQNIEILEKFKNNEMQRDKLERDVRCGGWKIGDIYKCLELDNAIDNILSDYKRVLKENEQLKNDIENMYDEEVVISIIEDNFNLSRNEVLEVLGSEE